MSSRTGNGRVQIAYLHPHKVSHSWHESMMRLIGYDAANNSRIIDTAGPFMISCDAGGLVEGRNAGVQRFLDETDHEWLWWVDTDMGFLPDTIDRLVDAADPAERPVVGALCFGLREVVGDGYGGRRVMPVPTLYMPAKDEQGHIGFSNRFEYPKDTVLQVAGTGTACLLIHRTVLEKMRAEHGDHWFDRVRYEDGKFISEDLSFCYRLVMQGTPLFVHTGVKTTHHKQFWVSEDDYVPPGPPVDPGAIPEVWVDVAASMSVWATGGHEQDVAGLRTWKTKPDLDRYERAIADTRPEVIVETGTRWGGSALWFAQHGCAVITVDVDQSASGPVEDLAGGRVTRIEGSSTDPEIIARVTELVAGRRCMVVLDSDHHEPHVTREIHAYAPLVSPGCHLVVEDGIADLAGEQGRIIGQHIPERGGPLRSIVATLVDAEGWTRDVDLERSHPITHHPLGWWRRDG